VVFFKSQVHALLGVAISESTRVFHQGNQVPILIVKEKYFKLWPRSASIYDVFLVNYLLGLNGSTFCTGTSCGIRNNTIY